MKISVVLGPRKPQKADILGATNNNSTLFLRIQNFCSGTPPGFRRLGEEKGDQSTLLSPSLPTLTLTLQKLRKIMLFKLKILRTTNTFSPPSLRRRPLYENNNPRRHLCGDGGDDNDNQDGSVTATALNDDYGRGIILFPTIPIVESVFDIITLTLISCLILLSILSVCFIFHLRIKSRQSYPLQNFNSLWSIRLVLVAFVVCWAINETLRLPLFHRQYLYPLMPAMDILQQASICRIHVVLSLGFFEPGFLITLLFLVNVSIKERNPRVSWSIPLILLSCLPIFLLQTLVVFFSPLGEIFPAGFQVTSVASIDETFHDESVMCTYPLFSIMVFAAFGIAYSMWLLFAYWRVITFVINKGTLTRIHILVFVIIVSLPLQVFFLTFSSFWLPEDAKHGGALLGMFVTVAICVAVGEGILVIKPISDALAASGACCAYNPADGRPETDLQHVEVVHSHRQ
ncbi:hypothetical protein NMG60_11020088 [Bertholletia excelsa]